MAIKSDHNRSHFYIYFNWLLLKILYMNADKAQFLKTTVPAWDAEAKAAGRLAQ